ncbi:alpha/beta fold hydrolase [Lutimaribacter sp. EGI FJ00015]|uniref:Alpha/beta fold hydrolase n=1 Tax=Lutimaribacter degradans TaxID=2945989 RepID=A0ACC5ZSY9_9RHOB|nr:alpha/beta fold hydrolase [Lutimaribacter sp. EGI FJ00013]MCM2561063.1 alpha/beta fold hydrolase [Lutimaribacter sp. EGI FJ00013]MCO0611989.1 alpha/beta fold hydrolase [Lutimaribacter sp. EGI FJ00015]MCO0634891.1 alpha/beta fold hydrolase [Lutimaribacter sp. EGI FJ00014]
MIYTVSKILGIAVVAYLAIALGLILSQRPGPLPEGGVLDFTGLIQAPFDPPQDAPRFRRTHFVATDGNRLPMTVVDDPAAPAAKPIVVMLHGSGWHGMQFDRLAWALRDVAELRAVTLRGHGADPVRRGDVDYVGQLEDDLAAAIGDADGRKVVLLGHSSGGGLVVRFAGGTHRGLIDGAILLAPFLQYDAPVTRENSGGWAHVLTRRIVGLSMLNMVGIRGLDGLKMIQFAIPRAVLDGPLGDTATTAYSWRLNLSYAPRRDYLSDVAALPPFLLVAGAQDQSLVAEGYEPLMSGATDNGRYHVLPDVGHLDVVDVSATETLIRGFLRDI